MTSARPSSESCHPPAGRSQIERRNVATALTLFGQGWGARPGWEDVWKRVFDPDIVSRFHAFPPIRGLEAAMAFNADLFAGFPDLKVAITSVTAESDTVVVQSRLTGRHEGAFLNVSASGASVDVPDVTILRFGADGRILESRYFTDLLAVMTTIGAVPAVA
ncbi:MAG: ester cyclase [Pseudomonadota bacterium]